MSRAADQRIVYALKNGRLVPKSEVLGQVAGASAPVTVEDEPAAVEPEPAAVEPEAEADAEAPRRRGRPPKAREDEASEDVSEFKIED